MHSGTGYLRGALKSKCAKKYESIDEGRRVIPRNSLQRTGRLAFRCFYDLPKEIPKTLYVFRKPELLKDPERA